ncbi:MAG TPA: LamG domain-containing protein, partial [Planctomycetota bacterium]
LALWGSLGFIAVVGGVGLTIALAGRKPPISPEPPAIVDPPPSRPRPAPSGEPGDIDIDQLRRLMAGPPAEWKRDAIEAALARRPDLEGLRKDYARGLAGLGLLDGLVGHWPLDDAEGSVVRDATGRGNDGKVIGAPLRAPGKIGGAFRFRGNDEDGVEIPAANELDTLEAKSYSLCAWFKPDQRPAGKELKSNDSWYALLTRPGLHLGLCYDRQGHAEFSSWLDGQKQNGHVSSDTIAPGAWAHAVGLIDAVEGKCRVYVNGRPSGESTWAPRTRHHRHTGAWRIGIAGPQSKEWSWSMKGLIDDVRFYARSLAPEEIALLAEGVPLPAAAPPGRTPSNDGLVFHLRADAGVAADGGVVNAWGDVERKIAPHSEDDERPTVKPTGIVWDGKNDKLALHSLPEFLFKESDSFTLMARVHFETAPRGRWMGLFTKGSERVPPWYGLYLDPEGRWVFGSNLNLHGSPTKAGTTTVTALQIGGRERRIYVDGTRVATGPSMDASGPGDLWIGGVKGKSEYFNGAIQEIRLWRRALEPSELLIK